jgi:hypothetical protein
MMVVSGDHPVTLLLLHSLLLTLHIPGLRFEGRRVVVWRIVYRLNYWRVCVVYPVAGTYSFGTAVDQSYGVFKFMTLRTCL